MSNPKPKSGSSRGLCAWLREHLRPSAVSRLSHTKVQVLSKTTGEPWSNPSSQGNIQSPWKRISDIRGEVKGNATKLESFELSQQNGAKKTSDVPVCSGKSSRKSRSFIRALICRRGNRRTGKVAPLPVDNSGQKGALKTSNAPTSSGKPSKESGPLLQRFPGCKDNQSTVKLAPIPVSESQSCMSNDSFAKERNNRDLILSDLDNMDDETTLTKPANLPSGGKLIGEQLEHEQRVPLFESSRLQETNEAGKCDGNRLLGKKHEAAKQSIGHENQRNVRGSRGRRGTVQKEMVSKLSLDHGDNKSYPSPGFLLHSKPSRGGGQRVQDVDSIQREHTHKRYSWTSQSSMYDIWQRTEESEDETKLADWDSKNSLTSSEYIDQDVCSAEPSAFVGRSHATMKPEWFTDFNKTNDQSKMSKPKNRRGLAANEGCDKEDFDFLSLDHCNENIDTKHGAPAIRQNHPLGDFGISSETEKKDFNFDIWRNDFEENETLEKILKEEDDGEQSSIDSSYMSLVYDTWYGSNECEENTMSKTVDPSQTEENNTEESKSEFSGNTPSPSEDSSGSTENILEEKEETNDLFSGQKQLVGSEQVSYMDSAESKTDTWEEEGKKDTRFDDSQKEEEEDFGVDSEEKELTIKELEKLNERQKEQWELAALGEWSLICYDDEDDEDSTNLYLMKDELQKEQEVRQNLKSIICEFQDLQVIKDLQKMLTLPGCPREQIERALRQYARICHGPVPLSVSGQSKSEAVASLSVILHRRTKRFVQNQPCSFKEFASVVEELDILRERQDSLEDSLKRNLRKEETKKRKVRSPKRRRKIKRWAPNRKLFLWEVDMILMETYYLYEGKIKSRCRVDVMPIIVE